MKEIKATEQIFNAIGQRVGLKYHYADGTSREVTERSTVSQVSSKLKDAMKKFEEKK